MKGDIVKKYKNILFYNFIDHVFEYVKMDIPPSKEDILQYIKILPKVIKFGIYNKEN